MAEAIISFDKVNKWYGNNFHVLRDIDLVVPKGERIVICGPSGSGKSTLIRSIGGLVAIDAGGKRGLDSSAGQILICGIPMQQQGRVSEHANGLRSRVGIIFQQFNLVPRLSVLANVCLGFLGQVPRWRGTLGWFTQAEKKKAIQALTRVGITEQALKRGSQLSGGQQQRAAIARSLVQGSEILIADEPIASLDPSSARRVMDMLAELNRSDGITVLVSLHQVEYALNYCPRTIALRDGAVVYDGPSSALTPAFLGELYGAESEELFLPRVGDEVGAATPERDRRQPGSRPGYAREPALAGATA